MDLDQEELAQLAQVEEAAKQAKQTIKAYFAMRRGFLASTSSFGSSSGSKTTSDKESGGNGRATTARMRELVDLFTKEINALPDDRYTFPTLNARLNAHGHQVTRDQTRHIMRLMVGKAPVFPVTPRSGSVPGVYSRVPVEKGIGMPTSLFSARNGQIQVSAGVEKENEP